VPGSLLGSNCTVISPVHCYLFKNAATREFEIIYGLHSVAVGLYYSKKTSASSHDAVIDTGLPSY